MYTIKMQGKMTHVPESLRIALGFKDDDEDVVGDVVEDVVHDDDALTDDERSRELSELDDDDFPDDEDDGYEVDGYEVVGDVVHEVVDTAVVHDEIVALTVVHEVVDGVIVVNNDHVSWPWGRDNDTDYSHYNIDINNSINNDIDHYYDDVITIRRPVYRVFENTLQFNSNGSLDLSIPVNRDIVNNIAVLQDESHTPIDLRDVVQVFYINDNNEVVTRRFATEDDCCRYFNIEEWLNDWVDLYHPTPN